MLSLIFIFIKGNLEICVKPITECCIVYMSARGLYSLTAFELNNKQTYKYSSKYLTPVQVLVTNASRLASTSSVPKPYVTIGCQITLTNPQIYKFMTAASRSMSGVAMSNRYLTTVHISKDSIHEKRRHT